MCELWLGALMSPALVWLLPSVSPAAAIELLSPQFLSSRQHQLHMASGIYSGEEGRIYNHERVPALANGSAGPKCQRILFTLQPRQWGKYF